MALIGVFICETDISRTLNFSVSTGFAFQFETDCTAARSQHCLFKFTFFSSKQSLLSNVCLYVILSTSWSLKDILSAFWTYGPSNMCLQLEETGLDGLSYFFYSALEWGLCPDGIEQLNFRIWGLKYTFFNWKMRMYVVTCFFCDFCFALFIYLFF